MQIEPVGGEVKGKPALDSVGDPNVAWAQSTAAGAGREDGKDNRRGVQAESAVPWPESRRHAEPSDDRTNDPDNLILDDSERAQAKTFPAQGRSLPRIGINQASAGAPYCETSATLQNQHALRMLAFYTAWRHAPDSPSARASARASAVQMDAAGAALPRTGQALMPTPSPRAGGGFRAPWPAAKRTAKSAADHTQWGSRAVTRSRTPTSPARKAGSASFDVDLLLVLLCRG